MAVKLNRLENYVQRPDRQTDRQTDRQHVTSYADFQYEHDPNGVKH